MHVAGVHGHGQRRANALLRQACHDPCEPVEASQAPQPVVDGLEAVHADLQVQAAGGQGRQQFAPRRDQQPVGEHHQQGVVVRQQDLPADLIDFRVHQRFAAGEIENTRAQRIGLGHDARNLRRR